jgi:hypothetical protein
MGVFDTPITPFAASSVLAIGASSTPAFQHVHHTDFKRTTPAFSASSTIISGVASTPFSFRSMVSFSQMGTTIGSSTFRASSSFFDGQSSSFGMCYLVFSL